MIPIFLDREKLRGSFGSEEGTGNLRTAPSRATSKALPSTWLADVIPPFPSSISSMQYTFSLAAAAVGKEFSIINIDVLKKRQICEDFREQ
jgi:hypothetical protein